MFYDNFIKACNSIGKTPSAALSEAGIDKSASTRWKNGKKPTDATLQKLADYFGINPSDLTGETHLKVIRGEVIADNDVSQEAMGIARAYDRADKRTKDLVRLALEPFGLFDSLGEKMCLPLCEGKE